jgi:hypothetical protein
MHARTLNKDLAGSLLVIAIGVLVAGVGFTYRTGTLRQMGAGFLPVVFGVLMTLVGLAMAISSRTAAPAEDEPPAEPRTDSPWRGWLCIVGGVVAFVVLGDHGGLVPAAFFSVWLAALGDRQNTIASAAGLAAVIVAFSVAVFHYGLQVQLPLFQWV